MAIDWDAELLGPVMSVFGEGNPADSSTWPLYTPAGGTAFQLADAVLDRAYTDITLADDGSDNTTRKPCLGVRVALFGDTPPQQSDTVYIPSVGLNFIVRDVRPDGHGHARLLLMEMAA